MVNNRVRKRVRMQREDLLAQVAAPTEHVLPVAHLVRVRARVRVRVRAFRVRVRARVRVRVRVRVT